MSVNVMFSLEIRPHFTGDWEYEDRFATYQGDVDITLRHPNPRSHLRPRRLTVPIIYIMHVPPMYVHRVSTPPRRSGRPNARDCNGYSPSPTRNRIVREYDPSAPRRCRTRSPRGGIYVLGDEEEEEDPAEGSTGGGWTTD